MTDRPIGKILIVDDEEELKNALVEALTAQSFLVQGYIDAREALNALSEEDFDLLLTDLMMPEMNGIDLIKTAREIDPNLVAIIMTGQGTIQTAVDAMKIGAFDYVLKPFRLTTVMPVLTRAMNTRRLRLENLQLRETVAIYELGQTIAFTLDPQTVISKLADAALQQTDADEVSILLPTEDSSELYVAAVRGENRQKLLGERVSLEESISSWVVRQRQPLILDGEINDERFRALWPRPEIRSAISIPMQVANKLVGTININALNRARPFTLGQLKALTILASTAASALESASLYTQVRQAEESYRSIFENAVEGIARSTPEGAFITVNPALARILGYDSPEDLLAHVTDIARQIYVHPEERQRSEQIENREGVLHGFEFEAFRKNGEKIWLSLNRRSVRDETGKVLFHESSVEDITESKHAEQELRQAKDFSENLIQTANVIILGLDTEGNINIFNEAAEKITGYTAAELRGHSWFEKLVPKDRYPHVWTEFKRLIDGGGPQTFENPILTKDGEERHIMWQNNQVRVGDEVVATISFGNDITERKRAEAELRFQKSLLESQSESSIDGILVVSKEMRVLSFNKRFVELWEIPEPSPAEADEITLNRVLEKVVSPEGFLARVDHLYQHPDEKSREEIALKDGRTFDRYSAPIKSAEGEYYGRIWFFRDITERKRAEEILRESEASFKELFDDAPVAYHELDREGRISRVNLTELRLLGYTAEEMQGRFAWEFIVEKASKQAVATKLSGEIGPQPFERTFIRKDGASVPVEIEDRLLYDADGKVRGIRSTLHDITERKRAEQALRESQERYRDLVENAHDIIYSHDLEGNFTSVNRAAEQITGYTHDESLAMNIFDTVAPEHAGRSREMIRRKLSGDEVTAYEMEIVAKDSRRVPVEVNTKLTYQNGVPVGVQGIARDITERKLAQAELTRLAAAVEQTADSVLITDPKGNIEYVNPAFERITGYSKEEVVGKNPRILKSGKNDPANYRELWDTILRREVWVGQLVNQKKDGSLFSERVTISAVLDDTKEIAHFVAVKQDITHEIQLEEQLRQSQKMEAIGQLAGGVAHDFNNLLTAINGYSSLALQKIEENHPLRNYLEEIKKAGDRAANLTRQLLAFGRKQILQPLPINLNDVVGDMNKMLRRLIGEDIVLSARLDSSLKRIQADPGQIEQVLVNLVVNARDAMPQGGTLTIETAMVDFDEEYAGKRLGTRPGSYVMLAVSDTGTGMDEQTQARIFDPFFTTKDKGKGTGLGLSTVYGIVKQSGGNIWVYSEPGRGTTFKVYLPPIESAGIQAEKAKVEVPIPRGSETVLLVEDEDVVRGLTRQILEQAGYEVVESARGKEAIRLYTESDRSIDLLLTDVVMPETSGKEVADQLTALKPGLKVLFMSGYTDEAIVHHGVLDSNIQFIQKPFTPAALARKVREVLDSNGNSRSKGKK